MTKEIHGSIDRIKEPLFYLETPTGEKMCYQYHHDSKTSGHVFKKCDDGFLVFKTREEAEAIRDKYRANDFECSVMPWPPAGPSRALRQAQGDASGTGEPETSNT